MNRKLAWKPDEPDSRDRVREPRLAPHELPEQVDLRQAPAPGFIEPPFEQGHLNSCTANAIASALHFAERKLAAHPDAVPSRLFIYYNERAIEGKVDENAPVSIRDGIKAVAREGCCPEELWPYDMDRYAEKPPQDAYEAARPHRAIAYRSVVQDLHHLKSCLAEGFPFVFGFHTYASWFSPPVGMTGDVPTPPADDDDEPMGGGHCVLAIGYDDSRSRFLFRNSHGTDWGAAGYGTVSYAMLTDETISSSTWEITRAT